MIDVERLNFNPQLHLGRHFRIIHNIPQGAAALSNPEEFINFVQQQESDPNSLLYNSNTLAALQQYRFVLNPHDRSLTLSQFQNKLPKNLNLNLRQIGIRLEYNNTIIDITSEKELIQFLVRNKFQNRILTSNRKISDHIFGTLKKHLKLLIDSETNLNKFIESNFTQLNDAKRSGQKSEIQSRLVHCFDNLSCEFRAALRNIRKSFNTYYSTVTKITKIPDKKL
jgi:hypothetical protein